MVCLRDYEEARVLGAEDRMKEMMGDKVGGRVGHMLCVVGRREGLRILFKCDE